MQADYIRVRMIHFLEQLVNMASPSGQERQVGEFLADRLQEFGFTVTRQPVDSDRFNILATTKHDPSILFCTHMDTVSPVIPFKRDGATLWGRGCCDAKGQITVMLTAARRLKQAGINNIGLLFVVDEENISAGAKAAATLPVSPDYIIVGEPTDNKLATGQKGVLVCRITAAGTGGHSSMPDQGRSAIHDLVRFLHPWLTRQWGRDPVLGQTFVNIGKINGGTGANILAPQATAMAIFRVTTSIQDIKNQLIDHVPDSIEIEILSASEPQTLIALPGFDTTVVGFGTDAGYLRPLGKILLFGPGSITTAHRQDEHITVEDLETGVTLLEKIVKQLLKRIQT
ncbi:MAG: M20/M25/M40 family metallo-hydrolase [candidate division KSB1 bacterium]|nr:M20/M25/M40 family metallo-hydrolase [candidate division KSB1 bacterium]